MRTTTLISLFFFGVIQVQGKVHHIVYDCTRTPGICKNFCFAVNCLGHSDTLGGGGQGDVNRLAWGDGTIAAKQLRQQPPVNDNTIEEYPYASSAQGGLKVGTKFVSLRTVPQLEQSRQGYLLRGIGSTPATDTWVTELTKVAAARLDVDWCLSTTACTADQEQYVPTAKGQFTTPQATTQPNQRRNLVGDGSGDGAGSISNKLAAYLSANEYIGSKPNTLESKDAHGNCYTRPMDKPQQWAGPVRRRGLNSLVERRALTRTKARVVAAWRLANVCSLKPGAKPKPLAAKPKPLANTVTLGNANSMPVSNARGTRTNSLSGRP
ncbi:hypothetical protein PspLS_12019 [Pyricularia sp. CBS 133598]|nr:hypothetical protein PspLS_12019 [Pyricularia sp. CBS 133598]